jgi:beta-glucosidase
MVRGHEAKDNSNSDFPYDSSARNGTKQVGTIVKHFIGYSTPDNGEDRSDATVPDWIMERYHVPAFRSAIAAGAAAVMLNSGSVNRVPGHANAKLSIELLRNKLKFNGTLVSDYQDVTKLVNVHRAVPNFREAVRTAVNAGLDVTMIPDQWAPTLLDLVNSGAVPVSRIDESVRRILKMKSDLGLFDASTNIGFPKNTFALTILLPKFQLVAH